MNEDIIKEIGALYDRINHLERTLDNYINQKNDTLKADIDYVAIMTDTYVDEGDEV